MEASMFKNTVRNNVIVIAGATAAALAAWGVCQLAAIDLGVGRGDNPSTVGVADVIIAVLVAAAAACVVHALMVRRGWQRWWPFLGSTVLAISITGPSYLADGESAVALICMHLVVGAVLIGGLNTLGPAADRCGDSPDDGRAVQRRDPLRGRNHPATSSQER
jgi:hypothetical protein